MLTPDQEKRAFDELWEHSLIGLAFMDEDGSFKAANPAFCAITEYTEFELQHKKFQDITHPEDREPDIQMTNRIIHGEDQMYTMKKRYITKTGRIVWTVLRARAVRSNEGKLEFFVSQISELIELQPPKLPTQYPSAHELGAGLKRSGFFGAIKNYWPMILAVLGGLGIVLAEAVKRLSN